MNLDDDKDHWDFVDLNDSKLAVAFFLYCMALRMLA